MTDTANTNQFTWNPKDHTLVAEISDLRELTIKPIIGNTPGFKLVSQRTGVMIHVVLFYEQRNQEGEVLAWHFKPLKDNNTRMTVVIFND